MTNGINFSSEIQHEIESQLETLATANHCGAGALLIKAGVGELRCRIQSTDRLACEVDSVQVVSPGFEQMGDAKLDELANDLVNRLSYLEERLTVVEKDLLAVEVQLRSAQPHSTADRAKSYFELMVGKCGLQLRRYRKQPECCRQAVPCVLTRPILVRLAQDLLAVS